MLAGASKATTRPIRRSRRPRPRPAGRLPDHALQRSLGVIACVVAACYLQVVAQPSHDDHSAFIRNRVGKLSCPRARWAKLMAQPSAVS